MNDSKETRNLTVDEIAIKQGIDQVSEGAPSLMEGGREVEEVKAGRVEERMERTTTDVPAWKMTGCSEAEGWIGRGWWLDGTRVGLGWTRVKVHRT